LSQATQTCVRNHLREQPSLGISPNELRDSPELTITQKRLPYVAHYLWCRALNVMVSCIGRHRIDTPSQ